MSEEKRYSVSELREIQSLSDAQNKLERRRREIAAQLADLDSRDTEIRREVARIEQKLGYEFTELEEVVSLLSSQVGPSVPVDPKLDAIKGAKYVKKEMKGRLLAAILEEYRQSKPNAKTMSYTDIKVILDQEYDIQCRSIANFFVGLLDEYETTGGNRNKAIVLPKR